MNHNVKMKLLSKSTHFAWLSIGTAVLTIGLKAVAYQITGSVGLLSDALESGVNLVTAVLALAMLSIAAQPPDADHQHGHGKAEYFSSGLEGGFILIAALTILGTVVRAFFNPVPLEQLGMGLIISLIAAGFNGLTAVVLRRAGRFYDSITLTASAHHLMSDVWTSIGVAVGISAVALTGWQWLDGLIGLAVALHILRAGYHLLRDSINGLMDRAIPEAELEEIEQVLEQFAGGEIAYHALRTRAAGAQRFVSVHIQVPGAWSVQEGHELLEEIEEALRQAVPRLHVITHLEPIEDPASWEDVALRHFEEPAAPFIFTP